MTKTNQYYYDRLRDCYNLVCENEQQRSNKPAAPIKKKKPTFEKSKYIKYGSDFADQGSGSRIRTTTKDWDEAVEQPKRKTLKEFRADAGSTTTLTTSRDKKNLEFMHQVFLAGKNIDDFDLFIGFVNHLL